MSEEAEQPPARKDPPPAEGKARKFQPRVPPKGKEKPPPAKRETESEPETGAADEEDNYWDGFNLEVS